MKSQFAIRIHACSVSILYCLPLTFFNISQENISAAGLSGSEVSDSGLTSEDEDSRVMFLFFFLFCSSNFCSQVPIILAVVYRFFCELKIQFIYAMPEICRCI